MENIGVSFLNHETLAMEIGNFYIDVGTQTALDFYW